MKYFKDISDFNNVNDYLPILNGCLNADLIIIFLAYHGFFQSRYLQKWYAKYQLSAVLADVLILFIGIILARFFYNYLFDSFSLWKFIGLAVFIQIIHDILFYLFFSSVPRGYNAMLDFFKDYAKEVGGNAILGDSFMMVLACLLSSHFAIYNLNTNLIILIVSLYFIPYIINYI
jgi:uncharacterized protein YacL